LALKAREKREVETALRKELLERQKAALASGSVVVPEQPVSIEYDENDERILLEDYSEAAIQKAFQLFKKT
jgi:hypothetical protein